MSFRAEFDPDRLNETAAIVGDVVHNLRSALDHLAAVAIEQNCSKSTIRTGFPICSNKSDLDAKINVKLSGAPEEFMEFVAQLKPYRDAGDITLANIADLNNLDKHRSLVPSVAVYRLINIIIANRSNASRLEFSASQESKDGKIFISILPIGDWTISSDNPTGYALKFQGTEFIDGSPVMDTLKIMHSRCLNIVEQAEHLAIK